MYSPFDFLNCHPNYLKQNEIDTRVSKLDPLNADTFFLTFPEINRLEDPLLLINQSMVLAQKVMSIENPSQETALAGLRDLGMLASSLTKKKIKVVQLPYLDSALAYLGKYSGEIPRDTFFSYTSRNPKEKRMRRFTVTPEEVLFVDSLREGLKELDHCIDALYQASHLFIFDPEFAGLVNKANKAFLVMVKMMTLVKKNLQPEVFTFQIRPYFEPYEVQGIKYNAPGASSMPVMLVDRLLWVNQVEDQVYKTYYEDAVSYLPFSYRYFASQLNSTPSLVNKIFQEIQNREIDDCAVSSIQSVSDLVSTILRFRCPHKRVVDDNFKLREPHVVGSGGYDATFLDYLIQRTFQTLKRLKVFLTPFPV